MLQDYPDVMGVKEAATVLRVGRQAIYNLINDGQLKSFRVGNTHKIPKKALTDFMETAVSSAKQRPAG